jgi:hypothetical protein
MKRFVLVAGVLFVTAVAPPSRGDDTGARVPPLRRWSGSSALTVPAGRWEVGLLGGVHHGLTDSLELAVNPLVLLALPHLEAKFMAARDRRHVLGLRARLSYPTTLLEIVSKEGQFGLLPATSRPPFAVQLEADAIATSEWFENELVSVWVGGAVAVHDSFTPEELPLLDFPFLYQRFAPLYGPGVPRLGFSFEGVVAGGLHYATELVAYLMPALPDVDGASAVEHGLELEYRFGERLALSAGLRTSYAKYPYGRRTHFLPFADVRAGF